MHWPYGKLADTLCVGMYVYTCVCDVCTCVCLCMCVYMYVCICVCRNGFLKRCTLANNFICCHCSVARTLRLHFLPRPPLPLTHCHCYEESPILPLPFRYVCQCVWESLRRFSEIAQNCFPFRFFFIGNVDLKFIAGKAQN